MDCSTGGLSLSNPVSDPGADAIILLQPTLLLAYLQP